jgi:excisionase family DNA binding protein
MGVDQILTMKWMEENLGVSRQTVLGWMNEKGLPSVRLGNTVLFLEESLMEWLRINEKIVRKAKQDSLLAVFDEKEG